MTDFKNQNIAIIWYWAEWKSNIDFLLKNWVNPQNITLLDQNLDIKLLDSHLELNIILWDNYLQNLDIFDMIIKSPGTSFYLAELIKYRDKITSGIQIFFDNYKGKVICISGTKGKSTTSSLIYETLRKAKQKTILLGNIGKPILSSIDLEKQEYDFVVLELSSYMLENLKKTNFISVLGNIYPDHLDWHLNLENYTNAKLNILSWSQYNIVFDETSEKLNLEEKYKNIKTYWKNRYYKFQNSKFIIDLSTKIRISQKQVVWGREILSDDKIRNFSEILIDNKELFDDTEVSLLGEHNRYNILASIAVCDILGIDPIIVHEVSRDFEPLAHRMQFVWEFKWIKFYDDAISTTPESTQASINTFAHQIDTIFLWWLDRWYDFSWLIKDLEKYSIKNIVLFPNSGTKIKLLLDSSYNILETSDMFKAVDFAFKYTSKWKICLLSCASPSYSIWKNFEEKWDLFQKYIKEFIKC